MVVEDALVHVVLLFYLSFKVTEPDVDTYQC